MAFKLVTSHSILQLIGTLDQYFPIWSRLVLPNEKSILGVTRNFAPFVGFYLHFLIADLDPLA
jgi:hypothetical protein